MSPPDCETCGNSRRYSPRNVTVQLGRSSVNMIEIIGGLEEGDQIILSDMSRWDSVDRVAMR